MTEKITTIYNGNNHVWPRFKIHISVMSHYENLQVLDNDYVSCGTHWDFYLHQQPIKLQQKQLV